MTDRAPNGLAGLKRRVTEYFANPEKFIDFSSKKDEGRCWDNDDDENCCERVSFKYRSFESVTNLVKLGGGGFSDVYAIDDDRVLKIVKTEDSGYARFVETCKENASNPHFPNIHYSGVWGGKTVYVLERLSEYPKNGDEEQNRYFRTAVQSAANPYMSPATKHVQQIADVLSENDMLGDLYSANLMFRGNIPVVTDPCCD